MNRLFWPIATAFTALLLALIATQTGWPSSNQPRHVELRRHGHTSDEAWDSSAAARYRQRSFTHWRDYMLQQ